MGENLLFFHAAFFAEIRECTIAKPVDPGAVNRYGT